MKGSTVISSPVLSSGSKTSGAQTLVAHSAIGIIKNCVNKPKAHIHMIAGLAPATNKLGMFGLFYVSLYLTFSSS